MGHSVNNTVAVLEELTNSMYNEYIMSTTSNHICTIFLTVKRYTTKIMFITK